MSTVIPRSFSHDVMTHALPDVRSDADVAASHERLLAATFQPGEEVVFSRNSHLPGVTGELLDKTLRRPQGLETPFRVRETRIVSGVLQDFAFDRVEIRLEYAAGWHHADHFAPAGTIRCYSTIVSDGSRVLVARRDELGAVAPFEIVALEGAALRVHGSLEALAALCSEHMLCTAAAIRQVEGGYALVAGAVRSSHLLYAPDVPEKPRPAAPVFSTLAKLSERPDADRTIYSCVLPEHLERVRGAGFAGLHWTSLANAFQGARKGLEADPDEVVFLSAPLSSVTKARGSGPIDDATVLGYGHEIDEMLLAA